MSTTSWILLRQGCIEEAIGQLRFAIESSTVPHPSVVMELGVAYLWLRDFRGAWEHFNAANEESTNRLSIFHEMAGVAKWCADEPEVAIDQWRSGISCDFADMAGGVKIPLLLFLASVFSPQHIKQQEALELLTERAKAPRAVNWPGPIAKYIVGDISEHDLRLRCKGVSDGDTILRHWIVSFYVGVIAYLKGNVTRFENVLLEASTINNDDFDSNKEQYLGKLWNGELFVARSELDKRYPHSSTSGI